MLESRTGILYRKPSKITLSLELLLMNTPSVLPIHTLTTPEILSTDTMVVCGNGPAHLSRGMKGL